MRTLGCVSLGAEDFILIKSRACHCSLHHTACVEWSFDSFPTVSSHVHKETAFISPDALNCCILTPIIQPWSPSDPPNPHTYRWLGQGIVQDWSAIPSHVHSTHRLLHLSHALLSSLKTSGDYRRTSICSSLVARSATHPGHSFDF